MAKNRIIFALWLATWAQGKGNMAACILIGTVACAVMEIIIAFALRKKLTALGANVAIRASRNQGYSLEVVEEGE